jgi:hypothetical protein
VNAAKGSGIDPYAVLGLDERAEGGELRAAYRRLAMRYHPDSSGDPGSARQFARVVRAYKVLSTRPTPPPLGGGSSSAFKRVIEAGDDLFALGQVLSADPDPRAREAAARRLGLSGRSAAYVFLRRALYDPDEAVALQAVRAVALLGSRQAGGEVAALFVRASPSLKRGILAAARATMEPLFRSVLELASRDPDPEIRESAGGPGS